MRELTGELFTRTGIKIPFKSEGTTWKTVTAVAPELRKFFDSVDEGFGPIGLYFVQLAFRQFLRVHAKQPQKISVVQVSGGRAGTNDECLTHWLCGDIASAGVQLAIYRDDLAGYRAFGGDSRLAVIHAVKLISSGKPEEALRWLELLAADKDVAELKIDAARLEGNAEQCRRSWR